MAAKKKWIASAVQNPGALTRKAKAAGMTVASFIANPPANISATTKKEIVLARTLKSLPRHKGPRKKAKRKNPGLLTGDFYWCAKKTILTSF